MPANVGNRRSNTRGRPPRQPGVEYIALSIRIDRRIYEKFAASAEENARSMSAEAEYQLRKIY